MLLTILMLETEQRFCLKHLHANMKSNGWKGQTYKDVFLKDAKYFSVVSFETHKRNRGIKQGCTSLFTFDSPKGMVAICLLYAL